MKFWFSFKLPKLRWPRVWPVGFWDWAIQGILAEPTGTIRGKKFGRNNLARRAIAQWQNPSINPVIWPVVAEFRISPGLGSTDISFGIGGQWSNPTALKPQFGAGDRRWSTGNGQNPPRIDEGGCAFILAPIARGRDQQGTFPYPVATGNGTMVGDGAMAKPIPRAG